MKTFSFFRKALCCLFVLGIAFSSCSDDDTKYDDQINKINDRLEKLEQLTKSFITKVEADPVGIKVTKADGTTETITVKGEKGEKGTSTAVTMNQETKTWWIDYGDGKGPQDTKVSYVGEKGEQGEQGPEGPAGPSTPGTDGSKVSYDPVTNTLTIDGTPYVLPKAEAGASTLVVVEKENFYEFYLDGAEKPYVVAKATYVVTSIELIPMEVSSTNVKGIYFPNITQEIFQKNPILDEAVGISEVWNYHGSLALANHPSSFNYSGTAQAKFRVNPASVAFDAFEIIGFTHEKAVVRALTPSADFTIIREGEAKPQFKDGILTINIAGKNISSNKPGAPSTKQSMISLLVENKQAPSLKEGEKSVVYSEYVPAISDDYDSDLVRDLRKSYEADPVTGEYPLATFLGESYHVLHPKMTVDGTGVYAPLRDLPNTSAPAGSTEAQKKDQYDLFLRAVKEVRNFTYVFDNSKPLVLKDHLDGIWDNKNSNPIASKYFKDNNFGYKLKFTPIVYKREGIDDQTKQYTTVDPVTGEFKVVKPKETGAGDKNFAAIDRIAVIGVSMVDAKDESIEYIARTIVVHIVSEEKEQPKEIEIRIDDQSVTLPNCASGASLDVDRIYNHKDVSKSKEDFNKQYTTFTPNLSTNLQGLITLSDDRQADNSIGITGIENLDVGTYEIAGIFTGSGVTTVNVVWVFEIKHVKLDAVIRELYVDNWKEYTVQATGRETNPLLSNKPWDEITVLKNSFKRYYREDIRPGLAGVELLDDNGDFCRVAPVELAFILIDKKTGKPLDAATTGGVASHKWNTRHLNYGIKHELAGLQVENDPTLYVNAALYNRFVDLRLDWTKEGRSYVNRNTVAVQAVAYVDQDYSYYIPINMADSKGGEEIIAKFDVQFNNPVKPVKGRDGAAVAKDIYLVDKKDDHHAHLGELISIEDFRGKDVYANGKWDKTLVEKYLVGADELGVLANSNAPKVTYKLHGQSANSEALQDKLTLDESTGIVTWVNKGEDLQKDLVVEFIVTVRNQWNLGEYADNKDHNDITVNTLKEIQAVVKVPLVTFEHGKQLPVINADGTVKP